MSPEAFQDKDLEKRRIDYAASMLDPYWLVQYISFDTQFKDKDLPDFIEWKKGTDLGIGVVFVQNELLGRYFKSQEEFLESCANPKNSDGEIVLDDREQPIQIVRDFNEESDRDQFPIDTKKYSAVKVFLEGSIALAARTEQSGDFSIDVYPSRNLKIDILQSLIALEQENIDKKQTQINSFQDRIEKYRGQLASLG